MWSRLLFIVGFSLGVLSGQAFMRYAYDPDVLEEVTLHSIGLAHFHGCKAQLPAEARGEPIDACARKALKYREEIREIWHDKAWRKR